MAKGSKKRGLKRNNRPAARRASKAKTSTRKAARRAAPKRVAKTKASARKAIRRAAPKRATKTKASAKKAIRRAAPSQAMHDAVVKILAERSNQHNKSPVCYLQLASGREICFLQSDGSYAQCQPYYGPNTQPPCG